MEEERECLRCGTLLGDESEGICPTCGAVFGRETIAMPAIARPPGSSPNMLAKSGDPLAGVLESMPETPPSSSSFMPAPGPMGVAKSSDNKLLWVLAGVIALLAVVLIVITIVIVAG